MLLGEQRVLLAVEHDLNENTRRRAVLEFEKSSLSLDVARIEEEKIQSEQAHKTVVYSLRERLDVLSS